MNKQGHYSKNSTAQFTVHGLGIAIAEEEAHAKLVATQTVDITAIAATLAQLDSLPAGYDVADVLTNVSAKISAKIAARESWNDMNEATMAQLVSEMQTRLSGLR